jgi:hypothetical protein
VNFKQIKTAKSLLLTFINCVKTELSDLYFLKYKFTRNIVKGQLNTNRIKKLLFNGCYEMLKNLKVDMK